jgi:putative endonuclease
LEDLKYNLKQSDAMAFVYILLSGKDRGAYIGSTRNFLIRLKEHQYGHVTSTKSRQPMMSIYYEEFDTYSQARKRELYLKTGTERDWIKDNAMKDINPVF